MSTKDQFIKNLIEKLNKINERRIVDDEQPIDVCYMVSVVDQQIENYKEFLDDIAKNTYYINAYDDDNSGGYTNGKVEIVIRNSNEEKPFAYIIDFSLDDRSLGYCQCTSDMEGYNKEYGCCGRDCDWYAPTFTVTKKTYLGCSSWDGQQRDYWQYEEQFELNEQNKNKEVDKLKKERKRESLQNIIKEIQEELKALDEEVI